MTDDAIAKLYVCDVKFRQIEGNARKFRPIELSNSVISLCSNSGDRYIIHSIHRARKEEGEGKNKKNYRYLYNTVQYSKDSKVLDREIKNLGTEGEY